MHTWRNGGWLNEAWQNRMPPPGKRAKDFMRRCMYLPALPEEVRKVLADAQRNPPPRARQVPAYVAPLPRPQLEPVAPARAAVGPAPRATQVQAPPVPPAHLTLGMLLFLLPPVGLASLWADAAYPKDGKLALTAVTALWLCLVTLFAIACVT